MTGRTRQGMRTRGFIKCPITGGTLTLARCAEWREFKQGCKSCTAKPFFKDRINFGTAPSTADKKLNVVVSKSSCIGCGCTISGKAKRCASCRSASKNKKTGSCAGLPDKPCGKSISRHATRCRSCFTELTRSKRRRVT